MIIQLHPDIPQSEAERLARSVAAFYVHDGEKQLLVTSSSEKSLHPTLERFAKSHWVADSDIQLSSRSYRAENRITRMGDIELGNGLNTVVIGGPCSVENESQIRSAAQLVKDNGLHIFRAGAFKPRTSPYTFQGLGMEGLELLEMVRAEYGLRIITEVKDSSHVEAVIETADIIQIGAKAMYDHSILHACGESRKPVLIKRGFGTTLQEFAQAAEFILSKGNMQVMLCERGIRSFETKTRFTLDLCGAAWLKHACNLPIILDPSHAMGYAYGVPDLARACMAMGVDGLLIETHPEPAKALSDASQQLNPSEFTALVASLHPIAKAIDRKLI